jgi:putative transcriptional regulator
VLRFKVKELIADKEFNEGRKVTIAEVAEACGMNRMTLTKICNQKGYSTVTDNLNKLCNYFDCKIEDLVLHVASDKDD